MFKIKPKTRRAKKRYGEESQEKQLAKQLGTINPVTLKKQFSVYVFPKQLM